MQHFDLAVIGSGSGNSLIDERFEGQRVALIERDPVFGGTCLNRGCIPTKMYVYPADVLSSVDEAQKLGITLRPGKADWQAIRDRVFGRIDPISAGGLAWRERNAHVTVFHDEASFVDPHVLRVGNTEIRADQIVLATGSRPRMLNVPGLAELADRIHTSDTVMRIDEMPERIVILGGGFVAAEFAHVFASFGVDVTMVHRSEVFLREEDEEVQAAFAAQLSKRVRMRLNQRVSAFEEGPAGDVAVVTQDRNGVEYVYYTDLVLVAVGRERNYEALNLDAAGVEYKPNGQVRVDAHQRTNVPHIWALGDISSDYLLKHVANHEMRTVQHNLLYPDNLIESDHRYVPAAVFTQPQIASVGATERQLVQWGNPYVKKVQRYADVAYGWAMEDEGHFVKLLADPRSWHLLGAHIIGPQASTLIQPLVQAMSFGLSVPDMAKGQYWIHPALPEVIENALLGLLHVERPQELEHG
ncbi:mycothione reductase [Tessaracoccus oleiagri]|uniref:Mycothione reductase n=1 Tax=Tessaracoccus oleiagri TaxID=686624 RepID=A0A1G9MVE9_9ACTN|nr:mycothione reductase [Tessaracoccus oleiagri]SDL78199.1 mycothione reductase [Tessaracoccus oleiagri]